VREAIYEGRMIRVGHVFEYTPVSGRSRAGQVIPVCVTNAAIPDGGRVLIRATFADGTDGDFLPSEIGRQLSREEWEAALRAERHSAASEPGDL
jgi:hypothetical protein